MVQEESYKIYFAIFGHSYKFLRILEICTIFWELNKSTNDLIGRTVPDLKPGPWPQPTGCGGLQCTVAGCRMGLSLAARSSHVCGLRARDGAVVGLPTARRRLAGGEVHPESTREALG